MQPSRPVQNLMLYLVWDAEGIQESQDRVLEQIFESVDAEDSDAESDQPKKRKGKKGKKRSSSGSSSDSRKSSDSSPSDDEALALHASYIRVNWWPVDYALCRLPQWCIWVVHACFTTYDSKNGEQLVGK